MMKGCKKGRGALKHSLDRKKRDDGSCLSLEGRVSELSSAAGCPYPSPCTVSSSVFCTYRLKMLGCVEMCEALPWGCPKESSPRSHPRRRSKPAAVAAREAGTEERELVALQPGCIFPPRGTLKKTISHYPNEVIILRRGYRVRISPWPPAQPPPPPLWQQWEVAVCPPL